MKFGVGVLLSAFGSFWVGEGIGLEWPGSAWAVLALVAMCLAIGLALVPLCRRLRSAAPAHAKTPTPSPTKAKAGPVAIIASELWGLFVDDGGLAAGTVVWVSLAWPGLRSAGPFCQWRLKVCCSQPVCRGCSPSVPGVACADEKPTGPSGLLRQSPAASP